MKKNQSNIEQIQKKISEIQEYKEKEIKQDRFWMKIKLLLFIIPIILLFPIIGGIKSEFIKLTEKEYIDRIGSRTMEIAPYITNEFVKKTQEVVPKIYDDLDEEIISFAEKISKDVSNKHIPEIIANLEAKGVDFLENATIKTEQELNDYVSRKVEEIGIAIETDMSNLYEDNKFEDFWTEERKEEIEELILDNFNGTTQMVEHMKKDLVFNLHNCIENSKNIFYTVKSYESLPENDKSDYVLNMMRGFVDGIEYIATGQEPDKYDEKENLTTQEVELYNTYLRKSRFGSYIIRNLDSEPWWNNYDEYTQNKVKKMLNERLGHDL